MAVRVIGTTTQVVVGGRLEGDRLGQLARHLIDALRGRPQILVMDLDAVTVVEPSCLGLLAQIQTLARSQDTELVVLRPTVADVELLDGLDLALGEGRHAVDGTEGIRWAD